nr:MAG TPA: hypothetical protein [Bacteriophage sp.]
MYVRCHSGVAKNTSSITTVNSGDGVAVREKRADYRYETCHKYATLKSCRLGIRSPVRLFHI